MGYSAVIPEEKLSKIPPRPVVAVRDVVADLPHVRKKRTVIEHCQNAVVMWVDKVFDSFPSAWTIVPTRDVFLRPPESFHGGIRAGD